MIIKIPTFSPNNGTRLSLRCHSCGQIGTFEPLEQIKDVYSPGPPTAAFHLGHRKCPNPDCHAHVFCVFRGGGEVVRTYPPQRIDFDTKSIPEPIVKTFAEALTCHAENLHVAAAIMIRRTLEELCDDKKATGKTLKERIGGLQSNVVLPKELFTALDDLRLLGNDAAHVEAKTYDSIGDEEIGVAIELTKEVLKAVYQLDDLVSRLKSLKKG